MDTERDFTCSGEIKLPCAKVLAFGQNVCTAQKRRQPEGRLGALSEPFAGSENIQIGVQFQKSPKTSVFGDFFVAKSCFTVWVKNPDPHRDPHAETVGKEKKAPDGKICLPVRFLLLLTRLYNLSQDAAHSLGGLVLLLLRGVGVGAQGEPGIVVPRHGGHGFDVHAVLEGCGGEGVTEIMEPDMLQSGVLQDLLM